MNAFQPIRRATLLYPSGPAHDPNRLHLYVLLTDPIADPLNSCKVCSLLVGISSIYPDAYHDPTCILRLGDHPFLVRDSFVFYADAMVKETDKIVRGVEQGAFIARSLMESSIVNIISNGILLSNHTSPKVKRFYNFYLSQLSGTS
jgi:hypothetical protein